MLPIGTKYNKQPMLPNGYNRVDAIFDKNNCQ